MHLNPPVEEELEDSEEVAIISREADEMTIVEEIEVDDDDDVSLSGKGWNLMDNGVNGTDQDRDADGDRVGLKRKRTIRLVIRSRAFL